MQPIVNTTVKANTVVDGSTGNFCPPRGPRLGAHLSVAGGLERAVRAAAAVGCECLQIFVKNQRQWNAPALTDEQVRRFRAAVSASNVTPIVAHASYLLNLAAPAAAARRRSIEALADELHRCNALGLSGLILHPGSHLDAPLADGVRRIADSIDELFDRCGQGIAKLLLETTAGQGTSIGWRLEHLADIFGKVRDANRLGVCLDTCHLFAAGYDFRTEEDYSSLTAEIERTIGMANVRCIHVNDSKRELGSRVDRHEHIGKGRIGKKGFAHFVNDPRFRDVPFILETPKGVDGRSADLDKVNLRRIRALCGNPAGPARPPGGQKTR